MGLRNLESSRQMTKEFLFLRSAFTLEGSFMTNSEVQKWLIEQNQAVEVNVRRTAFSALKHWGYDSSYGSIRHDSGKFFSIDGIHVTSNWFEVSSWQQPIINQPEVGYLGFITKEFDGVLHFLVQAKVEPGNVNCVQLSPTLQATRSNYSQVHKGRKPLYLEYFQKAKPHQIILDQLQSEQGARFLKKRNRNIIIKVDEDVPLHDNFIWLTLAQIKSLMRIDNLVNMDSRTVVSGIPFGIQSNEVVDFFNFVGGSEKRIEGMILQSALSSKGAMHTIDDILSFITHYKSIYDLDVHKVPLDKVDQWILTDESVHHKENKYFRVIPVEVSISNREVINWGQPMVEPVQDGLCAFVCKEINGLLHFVVQAKLECGNHDIIELAPTVQALTGNYRELGIGKLPFLDHVLNAKKENILVDSLQSEEGGRFYKEQNRNMVILADDGLSEELPDKYIWMTLSQLHSFLRYNNYLNIQARTLIAALSFV